MSLITVDQSEKLAEVARIKDTDKARIVRQALDDYFTLFFSREGNNISLDGNEDSTEGDAA